MLPRALLLTPGAGSDREHPTLVAIERATPGLAVERVDFPYRRAGRKAPDRAPVLVECIRAEAVALAERAGCELGEILLGGRSMGGRMCSLAIAEGLPAAGLVLISYPLHPPGRPDRLRVAHFPGLHVPCLFVSGTRDAFGTADELTRWTATIPGVVTHEWIGGAGHDLKRADEQVAGIVAQWIEKLSPARRSG